MDKKCSKCQVVKSLDCFHNNKAKKDGKYYHCKECQRAYNKAHYTSNKQYYVDKAAKNRNAVNHKISSVKLRASQNNLPFDLTTEWLASRLDKCAITGLSFEKEASSPLCAHIDRVIPEKGYVQSNCQVVCKFYNMAKVNYTEQTVLKLMKLCVEGLEAKLNIE